MPKEEELSSTRGWRAPAWSLSVQKRGPKQGTFAHELKPERPYVLIGSSPNCDICLDEPQLPPVAYLVCNFERSVEVWPTSAISFPRWGIVQPGEDLAVGRTRIRISHPSLSPDSNPESDPVDLDVQFRWEGSKRRSKLKRSVTIMGRDQPSMLRIQGQRLHKCDHALVARGSELWLINLCSSNALFDVSENAVPTSSCDASSDSQFTRLSDPGDAGQIGGVTISIESKTGCIAEDDPTQQKIKHVAQGSREIEYRPRVWRASAPEFDPEMDANPNKTPSLLKSNPSTLDPGLTTRGEGVALDVNQAVACDKLDALLMDRMVRLRRQRVSKHRRLINSLLSRVGVVGSAAASLIATSSIMSSIHE